MPASAPPVGEIVAAKLQALGKRLRTLRKRHKVTAASAAEAAGMSRVTLHRIERGEPSVTMGAYASAIAALGLELELVDPVDRESKAGPASRIPSSIRLERYPQLERLAWQLHGVVEVTPQQALELYERNWRHVDKDRMPAEERALLEALVESLGGGRLLV